jgi:hypothetical protein
LCFVRDPLNGLVWATKILTDPFHDIKLYYRAPFYLLRGDMLDEMDVGDRARPSPLSQRKYEGLSGS